MLSVSASASARIGHSTARDRRFSEPPLDEAHIGINEAGNTVLKVMTIRQAPEDATSLQGYLGELRGAFTRPFRAATQARDTCSEEMLMTARDYLPESLGSALQEDRLSPRRHSECRKTSQGQLTSKQRSIDSRSASRTTRHHVAALCYPATSRRIRRRKRGRGRQEV